MATFFDETDHHSGLKCKPQDYNIAHIIEDNHGIDIILFASHYNEKTVMRIDTEPNSYPQSTSSWEGHLFN